MWPSLTYQLARIAEDTIALADPVFKKRFGLQIHEFRVLRLIDDQSCTTLTQLAALTKLDSTTTSAIVSHLMREGYLESDTPGFQLATTDKAKAVRRLADPLTNEMEELMLSVLDPNQRKELETIITTVTDWIRSGLRQEAAKRYPELAEPPGDAPG
jgi:DNA-binding MarR family transcriptional regulator